MRSPPAVPRIRRHISLLHIIVIFLFWLGVIVGSICPTVHRLLGQVDGVHGTGIEEPVESFQLGRSGSRVAVLYERGDPSGLTLSGVTALA
jgi:hypothetical protein